MATSRSLALKSALRAVVGPDVWVSVAECRRRPGQPVLIDVAVEGAAGIDALVAALRRAAKEVATTR